MALWRCRLILLGVLGRLRDDYLIRSLVVGAVVASARDALATLLARDVAGEGIVLSTVVLPDRSV